MLDASRYSPGYYPAPGNHTKWVSRNHISKPPVWCSVDMRDGNQSLVIPMSLPEKLEFFKTLVNIGFKEIEVGFPAANDTEYEFLRTIIEQDLIPSDVTIQVLTQCREHIIRRTFDACKGAPRAIIHFYNPISEAQREQVFRKSKEEIRAIAVDAAQIIRRFASEYEGNFRFEYTPESFTGAQPEFALEVCNAVLDVLQPSETNNVIINLPATVELSLPHVYASQVEYIHENLHHREFVTLSAHPHNDRGTGVADAELALLAGAQRIEGTLFGNGERTGNVDIVTLAMNLYTHGVNPGLDFSDMPALVECYEKCTRMRVHDRAPYAGDLVFAAFSGSHQDAIAKGMRWHEEQALHRWNVPYLPIDPRDINRTYDSDVIRVNSQSGKGGIAYLLEQSFGYILPKPMREHFSNLCKGISDREHRELRATDVHRLFRAHYLHHTNPIGFRDLRISRRHNVVSAEITFLYDEDVIPAQAFGNGSLDAISNALKSFTRLNYTLQEYSEHSLQEHGSGSVAAAYIGIQNPDGEMFWGAGTDTDIIHASAKALLSAVNNMLSESDC